MSNEKEVKPLREALRAYLYERHKSKEPPPTAESIRRALGWEWKPDKNQ
jgi:hypothetical protein